MTPLKARAALALLLAGLAAGCTTPPEVTDLSRMTAANASLVNSQLADFAKARRALTERRIESTARLREAVESRQAEFDGFLESARASATIAGEDKKPNFGTLVAELQRVADVEQARRDAAERQSAAIREAMLGDQAALSLPKDQLTTISKQLIELAKDESRKERLASFVEFMKQVVAEAKSARKEAEDSSKATLASVDSTTDAGVTTITATAAD